MTPPWTFASISKHHLRDHFESGEPALDEFLRRYARQNQEQDIGRTCVACRAGELVVLGYYTLSASSVAFENLPERERRRLPMYPIPVAHLGRLAVDTTVRGMRLGEHLLIHALEQVAKASDLLAVRAVEVRAKGERARSFYRKYGFSPLLDDQNHLYLSIAQVRALF